VVTKAVTLSPGSALACPKAIKSHASDGLTLINEVLDADVVQAIVHADHFRNQVQKEGYPLDHMHRSCLPHIVQAVAARDLLIRLSHLKLTQADASAMLSYLFGTIGKRRNDEAAAKLMACIDIFSPASNVLGPALGLWKPVPTHPAISSHRH